MTGREWAICTDPVLMLELLRASGRASDRKLRLFAVACSRRCWDLLDPFGRGAVEVAEHYADGLAGPDELRAARLACRFAGSQAAWYAAATSPTVAARNAALSAQHGARAACNDPHAECLAQAHLLQEIFGAPFDPLPPLDRSLLARDDRSIVRRAQEAYEQRIMPAGTLDPARLAALADALEGAGADRALLDHLCGPGPHVRGCFAVDRLLGNESDRERSRS